LGQNVAEPPIAIELVEDPHLSTGRREGRATVPARVSPALETRNAETVPLRINPPLRLVLSGNLWVHLENITPFGENLFEPRPSCGSVSCWPMRLNIRSFRGFGGNETEMIGTLDIELSLSMVFDEVREERIDDLIVSPIDKLLEDGLLVLVLVGARLVMGTRRVIVVLPIVLRLLLDTLEMALSKALRRAKDWSCPPPICFADSLTQMLRCDPGSHGSAIVLNRPACCRSIGVVWKKRANSVQPFLEGSTSWMRWIFMRFCSFVRISMASFCPSSPSQVSSLR